MDKLITVLTGLTAAATQANIAVPTIFGLIKTVHDLWPRQEGGSSDENPSLTDGELVSLMRQVFTDNHANNLELQAELQAQIDAGTIPNPD